MPAVQQGKHSQDIYYVGSLISSLIWEIEFPLMNDALEFSFSSTIGLLADAACNLCFCLFNVSGGLYFKSCLKVH